MFKSLESDDLKKAAEHLRAMRHEHHGDDDLFKWGLVSLVLDTGDFLDKDGYQVAFDELIQDNAISGQGETESFLYERFIKNFFTRQQKSPDTEKFANWKNALDDLKSEVTMSIRLGPPDGKRSFYKHWEAHDRQKLDEVYAHHESIYERFQMAARLSVADVNAAIDDMIDGRHPKVLEKLFKDNVQSALDVPIPELSDAQIRAMVEAIEPNSYEGINTFGNAVQREFAQALQQVGEHFILNASRPRLVSEQIGLIMSEVQNEAARHDLVHAMPAGRFNQFRERTFGVQLTRPEDMPLNRAVEMAKYLPDLAEKDEAQFSQDLQIVDHGIKICIAYDKILERMHKALEDDRDRLVTVSENSTTTEAFAHAPIPEAFEGKLNALRNSQMFLNHQAGNFGSMGRVLGEYQRSVGGMAAVASAIQLPAMDAIRTFNAYQLVRMKAFGKAISVGVFEELGVDQNAVNALATASQEDVAALVEQAHVNMIKKLSDELSGYDGQVQRQKDAAMMIIDQAADEAAGRFEVPEDPPETT